MFIRSSKNPILRPNRSISWQARKLYNPTVIYEEGIYHLFFRAVGRDWISRIGHAVSSDGMKFVKNSEPLIIPQGEFETHGVEDPRITKIKNKYYLAYTAFDGYSPRLSLATSYDLKRWRKHGPMIPQWSSYRAHAFRDLYDDLNDAPIPKKEWIKAGGIFPELFHTDYWMLFGDSHIWMARSQNGISWYPYPDWKPFLSPRIGTRLFDNTHVEMGPAPIRTEKGWLILYHGVDDKRAYQLGFILLDLKNPRKIVFRTDKPIFSPERNFETSGQVDILPGGIKAMKNMSQEELEKFIKESKKNKRMPQVIFCCGAVIVDGKLRIYYGAGDTYICTAVADLDEIWQFMERNPYKKI